MNKYQEVYNKIKNKEYDNWSAKARDLRSLGDSKINSYLYRLDDCTEALQEDRPDLFPDMSRGDIRQFGIDMEWCINERVKQLAEESEDRE